MQSKLLYNSNLLYQFIDYDNLVINELSTKQKFSQGEQHFQHGECEETYPQVEP